MKNLSLFNLFIIFVKVGAILIGGGYVILPILINEFVENRKLVEEQEIIDYFALSQTLPGLIAANISMFIGYKLKGKQGALIALLGIIFVPFWTIVLLASVLNKLTENYYAQAALWGIGVAVIALITLTAREVFQKAEKDLFFYLIFILSLVALLYFKLSPIQTILLCSFFGIIYKKISYKEAK